MSLTMLQILPELPLKEPTSIFLSVLAIILFVPLVFNRLKIPYIIGLIAAGMIVGPYGFHVLSRDAGFQMFGEVGLLYLMFLAGVEIDMYHLRRNYKKGILFGLLTFIIPMAAGIFGCRYLMDTSWLSAVLIATMFASHTLLTYPVITRFGLANSRGAVIAVCGTIIAVLLALIVLAEVVQIQIHDGFDLGQCSWLMFKLIVYVVVFGFFAPWLTRIFFRKFNDGVTQFVYVLAVVFLFSMVAQMVGVASILGAFYAGLVMNKFIPARSVLKSRIEFVGNAIFIPYFLVGVGMLINVRLIIEGWNVAWAAGIMTILALGSKWLAAFLSQKMLGLRSDQRTVLFGLSAGKAAATIAATMIGYEYGLLSENILNGAVLMILFCCIVASFATQRGAIKLRMRLTQEELNADHDLKMRPGRQMVAVANPVTAEGLMKLSALMRADRHEPKTVLLYVRNSEDSMREAMGKNAIKLASDVATEMDIKVSEVMRFDMNIVAGMVNVMKEMDCMEVVLGLHRPTNAIDSFLGFMEERLVQSTNNMITMSRCFVPVNTLKRMFLYVPPKAEYETGFLRWVLRVGNLARQLGSEVEVMASKSTAAFVKEAWEGNSFAFDYEFLDMESWDDFIVLSSRISEDDLFVVVSARKRSISYGTELEAMPSYLNRYFRRHNLILLYPEQFGNSTVQPAPLDALAHTL
jgi:Kef-type K+ transport system membrane component KefB/flavin-binding protein dodecin